MDAAWQEASDGLELSQKKGDEE
ncbi:MAG: hypothetical protein UW65_C0036G0009, partial [candidate division WWE3 bacterium GW2011_GWB1_44_4]